MYNTILTAVVVATFAVATAVTSTAASAADGSLQSSALAASGLLIYCIRNSGGGPWCFGGVALKSEAVSIVELC